MVVINKGNPFARRERVALGRGVHVYPRAVQVEGHGVFHGGIVFRSSRYPINDSVELLRGNGSPAGNVVLSGLSLRDLGYRKWPFGIVFNYLSVRKER